MQCNGQKMNVIIGGGLTGLASAYVLARSGEPCLLIEKEHKVGGLSQSYRFHDCIFDMGPHVLMWDNKTPAANLVKHIMTEGDYRITNWKMNFFMNDAYYGFPLGLIDYARLPKSYAFSFLKSVLFYSALDKSFKESMVSHVGESMYRNFFSQYINKKAGCHDGGEKLHEDWWIKAKRNAKNEIVRCQNGDDTSKALKILGKFLYIGSKLINVIKPKDKMLYPKGGIGVIPDKLWEAYEKCGGHTLVNCNDIAVVRSNDRIDRVVADNRSYKVKNLIWTAQTPQLCNLLSIQSEPLQYVSSGLVFLVLNKKRGRKKKVSCTYFPQPDIIFSRVYYPSYFCEETVPIGKDAICVELIVEGDLQRMSSEKIIEATKRDLERLQICDVKDIEAAEFKKLHQAYPIYPLDYENRLAQVWGQLEQYKNLYSIGRLGGFYFCMMYDAINQGIDAAEHIMATQDNSDAGEGGDAISYEISG